MSTEAYRAAQSILLIEVARILGPSAPSVDGLSLATLKEAAARLGVSYEELEAKARANAQEMIRSAGYDPRKEADVVACWDAMAAVARRHGAEYVTHALLAAERGATSRRCKPTA